MKNPGIGKRGLKLERRDDRGQALVETALVLPLLFLLLLGAAELGRVAYAAIEISNAARAGAQYGSQDAGTMGDTNGITTAAQNDASNLSGVMASASFGYSCSDSSTFNALSISIFLMVLFAVFDLSIAFYTYHYVSDAAREGTRYAMVRGSACSSQSHTTPCPVTSDEIASYVENLEYPGIDAGDFMTVTSTWLSQGSPSGTGNTWTACGTTAACKVHGNQVQVTVSYAFPLDIPLWKLESLSISSTSSMVISQ